MTAATATATDNVTSIGAAASTATGGKFKFFGRRAKKDGDTSMTAWGATWRIAGLVLLAAAFAALAGVGLHYGLAYVLTLGLEGTALMAAQVGASLVALAISAFGGWKIGGWIGNVITARAFTKLQAAVAA